MRIVIFAVIMAVFISCPAYAVTLKPGSPACLTEDLYSQLAEAILRSDMDALSWLGSNGCTISDKPLHVTVLDLSTWGSLAHLRVYRGKIAVEVWAARESLDGYDPLNP